jgi:hypothetical protein
MGSDEAQSGGSSRCARASERVTWRHAKSSLVQGERDVQVDQAAKRLLIVAMVILTATAPPAAYSLMPAASAGGLSTGGQAQPSIVSWVPRATASSPQRFQWSDAGVGALGTLAVVGIGSGVAVVVRRRAQPIGG